MTRINCIPVDELHYKHLVAEYRELPRIFALAREGNDIPDTYRLGTGHVKFFYNKLGWLYTRQCMLYDEMIKRGYNPSFNPKDLYKQWYHTKKHLWGEWSPTEHSMTINRERIADRLKSMEK